MYDTETTIFHIPIANGAIASLLPMNVFVSTS